MKKSTQFLLLIAVISVCFIQSSNSTPLFFDFFKNLFGGGGSGGNGNNNRPSYRPNQQQQWANGGQYTKQKKYPWDIFGMFGFKNIIRPNPGRPAYNNNNNRPMNNYNRPTNRPNYRPPSNNFGGNQAGRPIVNNNYRPNNGGNGGSRPNPWSTQTGNGNWPTGNGSPSSGYAPPNTNGYNPPPSRPSYGRPNNVGSVGQSGITQKPPEIITARIPTNGIVGPRPTVNIGGSGLGPQQQWSQQYIPARINGKPTYNGNTRGKPSYNGNQMATYFPTPPPASDFTTAAPQIDQQVSRLLFWGVPDPGFGFGRRVWTGH